MVGHPQCEGNDHECRIGLAACYEGRAAGNIEVGDIVDAEVFVDHPVLRASAHTRGADLMVAVAGLSPNLLAQVACFIVEPSASMAAEMGIFAPLLMIWIFAAAVRMGFRKKDSSPYAFGCAIGVLSLALHGMADFNFHITSNMILFTIWLAIITGE